MDFVITWVDDSDPEWKAQFNIYSKQTLNDNRDVRFRSWDNFHYWFRVLRNFSMVDKVHFVTWGHIPKWLNVNHLSDIVNIYSKSIYQLLIPEQLN